MLQLKAYPASCVLARLVATEMEINANHLVPASPKRTSQTPQGVLLDRLAQAQMTGMEMDVHWIE
ncbi:MAG: hypothetical protein BGO63_15395 [Candidatus Accumulibacter sp. 66-26]|nr:MAG: hypothetical protein BGO63_15395 [Candidatus Accumulibacter sp. 66-26]